MICERLEMATTGDDNHGNGHGNGNGYNSFLFKSASSAQTMVLFVNFVTGLALMVVSFVLNLVESTRDVNAKLKWVYRLFPG